MEFGFKTPLTRGPVVKSQIRHLTGELQRNHSPDISASVVVDFSEVLITGAARFIIVRCSFSEADPRDDDDACRTLMRTYGTPYVVKRAPFGRQ